MTRPARRSPFTRSLLGLGATSLTLFAAPMLAEAAVLRVCPAGCDETTIQAAIDAADAGDTIFLDQVTPHTEVGIAVDKDLTIEGVTESQTIIQADTGPWIAPGRVFTIEAGHRVTMRDLTIRYGNTTADGGGLFIEPTAVPSAEVRLERVTLRDNRARDGGAIANGSRLTLDDVLIARNDATRDGGGLYDTGSATAHANVEISFNEAPRYGGGVYQSGVDSGAGQSLTLHGANIVDNEAQWGGGIYNLGAMTLDQGTAIELNTATVGGGVFHSGAQWAWIRDSQINSNSVVPAAGFIDRIGGGLAVQGALDIRDSEIRFNTTNAGGGGYGGGMYLGPGAEVTAKQLSISNNAAVAGGGLYVNTSTIDTLVLERSAVRQNSAEGSGGGIYHNAGHADITNVTIGQNIAEGAGAGFYARNGDVTLQHVTIANNVADVLGATDASGGGVSFHPLGNPVVRLRDSIVADNAVNGASSYPDCNVTFSSGRFSLIGDNGPFLGFKCGVSGFTAGMIANTSPQLGAPVGTAFASVYPLLSQSPAIDAAGCSSATGTTILTDQRGASTPVDGDFDSVPACDMGAYEYLPEPSFATGLFAGLMLIATRRGRGSHATARSGRALMS